MILEEKYNDYIIKKDLSDQVIRLDIPRIKSRYNRGTSLFPALKDIITGDEYFKKNPFLSASVIFAKAKQFDDGLYAAIELALQDGSEKLTGKKLFLARILKALKDLPSVQNIIYARAFIFAALELAGQKPPGSDETKKLAGTLKENFLQKGFLSKPVSFYTRTEGLKSIFHQNRFLQTKLIPPDFPVLLSEGLMLNPMPLAQGIIKSEQKETYKTYLELNRKMTGPSSAEIKDLGHLINMICEDKEIYIEGYSALFPPSVSYESNFAVKLQEEGRLTEELSIADKVIEVIEKGTVNLKPDENSGWYDHQLYSLETLVLPEKAPEIKKLDFTESYRKELRELFKASLALIRETHVQHNLIPTIGIEDEEEKDVIEIYPALSVEPLITSYIRRAMSYNFIRKVLIDFFGEEYIRKTYRLTSEGKVTENLLDELIYMESLFYGTALISSQEIGHDMELSDDYKCHIKKEDAQKIAEEWIETFHEDKDISCDMRMMVPLFYDREKR